MNADDFGLSASINEGIIQACELGIVRSASILTNGEAVDDALDRALAIDQLGLGLHLTVVFGKPLAKPDKVPSLLFENGEFAKGYGAFLKRYLTGGIKLSEVEYEWERQREKLSEIELDHLDSHQHLHLLPGLFKLAVRLAVKWKIPFIRIPRENIRIKKRGSSVIPAKTLNFFSAGKKNCLLNNNLKTADNFFGSSFSGALYKPAWEELIKAVPVGLTEIMCHPGIEDPALRSIYGWNSGWQEELNALTDPQLMKEAEKHNIIFTNFREEL
ncbi:ChbG/HpnK family deacetylase [bacterium]|nr:ChbG/HpnK family deacetylase [bacterium]